MADKLTLDMEVRKVPLVPWLLNNAGTVVNRVLPSRLLFKLWWRWLGWVPLLRYRIGNDREWRTVTIRDVMENEAERLYEGGEG